MPTSSLLSQVVSQLQSYTSSLTSSAGLAKKLMTVFAVICGLVWMWRRIEHARGNERRIRALLRDAHGNIMPPNIALGQHAPSPLPSHHSSSSSSSSSSADDVRSLSPADRYLSERGSRTRRQAVCLTITPATSNLFQSIPTPTGDAAAVSLDPSAAAPLVFHDALVPILMSLAQHTTLHLICVEANKERQEAIMACLASCELFGLGLKKHRVLFCTTLKGKTAIIRHVEPNLCIDENKEMLLQLKPFLDEVIHIDASIKAPDVSGAVKSFPSLHAYFMPEQSKAAASAATAATTSS